MQLAAVHPACVEKAGQGHTHSWLQGPWMTCPHQDDYEFLRVMLRSTWKTHRLGGQRRGGTRQLQVRLQDRALLPDTPNLDIRLQSAAEPSTFS